MRYCAWRANSLSLSCRLLLPAFVARMPISGNAEIDFRGRFFMHFKRIPVTIIRGDLIAVMIFARSLSLLPLPIGCLASR
ncbi:MAG: hypothetical protein ACM3WS_01945 [Bacillota bacterium]